MCIRDRSGDDSVKNEKLSLNQVLQMVMLNLTDTINSSNAKVLLPKSDFFINGRKMQIMQLFQNLIGNGLKYQNGRELPCVTIEAKEVGDKIRIAVIDNGIGILQENLKKIFEPFKRLHNAAEYSGSGIGLATCKKIIEKIGSEFSVNSEVGKGSTFTFDLPKVKEEN